MGRTITSHHPGSAGAAVTASSARPPPGVRISRSSSAPAVAPTARRRRSSGKGVSTFSNWLRQAALAETTRPPSRTIWAAIGKASRAASRRRLRARDRRQARANPTPPIRASPVRSQAARPLTIPSLPKPAPECLARAGHSAQSPPCPFNPQLPVPNRAPRRPAALIMPDAGRPALAGIGANFEAALFLGPQDVTVLLRGARRPGRKLCCS